MIQNTISSSPIKMLSVAHVFLITMSNILVQYPFELFGFHTTCGAFIYPAIFILTELATRLSTAKVARHIIYRSMFPGLLISYGVACFIETPGDFSVNHLLVINSMALRIALACFFAYLAGQLLDILVFQRYINNISWWSAPIISTTIGNLVDTLLFFFIAFYHCSNPFLAQHWTEIAMVDICFKIAISFMAFIPIYGVILRMVRLKSFAKRI